MADETFIHPLWLLKIQSEPKFEQSDDQISFALIEREPATIEIAPYCRPDTMDRLQAGNADDAAAFTATKSTRSVRRVTPRGVRSDGATRRLVERR